ncbi:MAG: FixH family protein [Pseudomonadota bacterium]
MQSQSSPVKRTDKPRPWYTHRWPWLLMLGPALVILAGGYTTWLAFSRPDALVVDDYYTQGKAINQDLRRDRAAAALGLVSTLAYEPAAGKLTGTLLGKGVPVGGKIRLRMVHSTLPEKDFSLDVQPDQRGGFAVALPMLEKARWQVLIENERRDWRLSGAWIWPQQQGITIKADLPPLD